MKSNRKIEGNPFFSKENYRADFWTRRVDRPAYEVMGKPERYDLRDLLFSRAALVPGTENYRIHYSQHPELEETDKKLRTMSDPEARRRQKETNFSREPLAMALSDFSGIAEHLRELGRGPINKRKIELDPRRAAQNIKGVARYLGTDLVGITELNPAWVCSHWGRNERGGLRWGEPIEVPHKYAISMAVAQNFDMLLAGRGLNLAPEIDTIDAHAVKAPIIGLRLAAYIRALVYPAECAAPLGKVQHIPIVVDAGLGEAGRNGFLVTKEFGSGIRLTTVTTDLPIEIDSTLDIGMQDFCAKCTKCADNCRSGSITRGEKVTLRGFKVWPIDNERCLYLRLTHGTHSCFNCMSTCPWTKPRNILHRTAAELAARSSLARRSLIWLDDILYGRKLREHSYPDWLEYDKEKLNLKAKISTFLHKI